ncbi:hypothetical protein THRCLA_06844 [Thraustotheca clavata]|uniref:SMP-LTD domain-containing protein n=1 Tax=Thraustotheca clavata TaxID=74557 RepID=A0A1V9ZIM3_9STRA|nr:hypothetical protein THRCLA_06844 [Thraustotheca clavata]
MLLAFLLGFLVGAFSMVLIGWEPLLRGAIRLTSSKRKRRGPEQTVGDEEWIRFNILTQNLSLHPLSVSDILVYSQRVNEGQSNLTTFVDATTVDNLPWIEKMLTLQGVVKMLMECCVGSEKQMIIVETALHREDMERLRLALLQLSKPVATVFRSTVKVLLYVVQSTFSITRQEDAKAAQATMIELLANSFGPSLMISTLALKTFLTKYDDLHDQMMTLEMKRTEDALRELCCGASLQSVSNANPSSPTFDTSWVNSLAQRLFEEYSKDLLLIVIWEAKANRMIRKQSMPKSIESVELRQLKLGSKAPTLSNICVLPTKLPDEVALSMTLEYSGGLSFELHTFIPLSDFSRHSTAFSFRVFIESFTGRTRLFIPSPGKDVGHGWVSFEKIPQFKLRIESCQEPSQQLQQLSKLLTLEIQEMIEQNVVLPQWARIELPWHPFASTLDLILPSSRCSAQLSPRAKSFVETAGGIMGNAVGGALGGAFGGKVARAVGEKMGEHFAKYATSVLSPAVHDVVLSTKSVGKKQKANFFSTTKTNSPKKSTEKDASVPPDGIKIDELVALAISKKLMTTDNGRVEKQPASPKSTSPKKVDLSKLVEFAKQSKKDN